MSYQKYVGALGVFTALTVGVASNKAQEVKTVFVIAMENHNWTQPANQFTAGIQQIWFLQEHSVQRPTRRRQKSRR